MKIGRGFTIEGLLYVLGSACYFVLYNIVFLLACSECPFVHGFRHVARFGPPSGASAAQSQRPIRASIFSLIAFSILSRDTPPVSRAARVNVEVRSALVSDKASGFFPSALGT